MGSRSLQLARHLLDREPSRHLRRADLVGRRGISVRQRHFRNDLSGRTASGEVATVEQRDAVGYGVVNEYTP